MFDYGVPKEERATDWSGTIIGAAVLPVLFLFIYWGKAELGFTVSIVLAMIIIAIRLRWKMGRHVWFWATITLVLFLHIPFVFLVRWPESNVPTIVYSLPLGIVDFLFISGALGLAEKFFSKDASPGE